VRRYGQPTPAELARLFRLGLEEHFAPKQALHRAGAVCNRVYLVLAGVARHCYAPSGPAHTVAFCGPGGLLADSASFLTQQPGQLDLLAVTRLHVVSFSFGQVQQLCEAAPVWRECRRLLTEAQLRRLHQRALSLQLQPAAARYAELMRTYPALFNEVPLNQLASYLGMAKETLSRLRRGGPR
jgi:CRP-like cAMP-binding protein